jgi:hypothetical protein
MLRRTPACPPPPRDAPRPIHVRASCHRTPDTCASDAPSAPPPQCHLRAMALRRASKLSGARAPREPRNIWRGRLAAGEPPPTPLPRRCNPQLKGCGSLWNARDKKTDVRRATTYPE